MIYTKKNIKKSLLWSSIERVFTRGLQLIFGIILARLLSPSEFGVIGIVMMFISISQCISDGGLSHAIIQKKNRQNSDYSTVLWVNLIIAILFYSLLYGCSGIIAKFFEDENIHKVIRILGISIIISNISQIQLTKLTIELDFKKIGYFSIFSALISGIIGISLAYFDYGIWSLVAQNLIYYLTNLLLLTLFCKWGVGYKFSLSSFKSLFSFGSKILISSLIDSIFKNVYVFIIGKYYNSQILGIYSKARNFSELPTLNFTQIIQRVAFPVLSNFQNDNEILKKRYKELLLSACFLTFPIMTILANISSPLINLLLNDKWQSMDIIFTILCYASMLYPFHSINLNILTVKGRSDLFLKLEILKKILLVTFLILTFQIGLKAIVIGQLLHSIIALIINSSYSKFMIGYSTKEQLLDLLPIVVLTFFLGILTHILVVLGKETYLNLFISILIPLVSYLLIAKFLNFKELTYIKNFIK